MESNSPPENGPAQKRRRQSSISATRSARSVDPSSPACTELGHMRSDVTGSTSFVGSGSGIYFVRTVRSALARNISLDTEAIDTEMVPGEDDRIQERRENSPNAKYLWRAEEVNFASPGQDQEQREATFSITFEDLVQWSKPYFNLWHPPFPFLHAPTILGLFDRISLHGLSHLSVTEAIIVRSILSISLADRRQMPRENLRPVPANLIYNTIDEAISCLSPVLMQSSTISGIQATMSVQVFLISILRLNTASRFGGLIVRIAYHLGIHRCPARYTQFTIAEADIRRRIFWSIYSLERFLAQSLGLPIDLKDDDIDVCLPLNEIHHKSESDNAPAPGHRLFLLPTFLARSSKIKGLILELRHISVNNRIADPDQVSHIDSEISKWWNEVQDLVDPEDDYGDSAVSSRPRIILNPSHRVLLILQKHESVILLNRPVITSGHNSYAIAAAMQKCIEASKAIVSIVYQYIQESRRHGDSLDGRIQNPLVWPGFTWCVWMSGLILLYAASNGFYSVETAQREANRCVKILENLSLRGVFWPSTCAAAIKDLQQALSRKTEKSSTNGQLSNSTLRRQEASRPGVSDIPPRNPEPSREDIRNTVPIASGQNNAQSPFRRPPSNVQNNLTPTSGPTTPMIAERLDQSQVRQPLSFEADVAFLNDWPGISGQFRPMEDHFNGLHDFDDIFQLMDVPYHLTEQGYELSGAENP